jgi:hypothetical protein
MNKNILLVISIYSLQAQNNITFIIKDKAGSGVLFGACLF